MKKKVFKISLLLLFFISTTGLPVTIQLCNMAKDTECEMMNKKSMSKHCESTPAGNDLSNSNYSSQYSFNCCATKTINSLIKDSFVSFKTEIKFNLVELPHSLFTDIENNTVSAKLIFHLTDSSPPKSNDNNLYLSNSVLLI